jgi:predicted deacetylase
MKTFPKILLIIFSFIVILFLIRLISPAQVDDISPEIPCSELKIYNSDILYIIPNYNNISLSENKTWCEEILKINKTLELHGINHQPYREFFYENISQEDLTFAIGEFQKCFNQTPEKFKPPQLKISPQNKQLILDNNLTLATALNQLTHKVYHCNDSGIIPNRIIKIF